MYNESRSHSYFVVYELDIAVSALDIALGNHALRVQPTDYSLICRYRLEIVITRAAPAFHKLFIVIGCVLCWKINVSSILLKFTFM